MEEEYITQHRRGNGVLYGAGADHIWLVRNMRKTENEKLRQDTITVSCFLIAAVIYEIAINYQGQKIFTAILVNNAY